MRHEGNEVGPQRRQAPQLVRGRALRFVGSDVLDRGGDLPAEQGDELDLLRGEGIPLHPHEAEHPDRPGPHQQGRKQTALQAQREEIFLLRITAQLHRGPIDEPALQHLLEHRPPHGPR